MNNQDIAELFTITASLMELHDENPFKIRSYQSTAFTLEKISAPLESMNETEMLAIEGITKSISSKLLEINESGSFTELKQLIEKTPEGIFKLLKIKGLGPKKIKTLWKEHHIDTIDLLLEACENNTLASFKGFGNKTQESILNAIHFTLAHAHDMLYADAEKFALVCIDKIKAIDGVEQIAYAGELARKLPYVNKIHLIVSTSHKFEVIQHFDQLDWATPVKEKSTLSKWVGKLKNDDVELEINLCSPSEYGSRSILLNSDVAYLKQTHQNKTYINLVTHQSFASEQDFYTYIEKPFCISELREQENIEWLQSQTHFDALVEHAQLTGPFHNHSTYSDGLNTLEQMASYCKDLGYAYFGIADHSQTASYVNGLRIDRVLKQQEEIKILNQKLAPFKIFAGIESDILSDGELDYENDILATFDYVVASVHSNLTMQIDKATERLLKAIENPYTTMLGHLTGRLLLKREGYPLDMNAIIDACVQHNVIIEINANPIRLDMDWKHIRKALDKGALFSINPDAHELKGIHDMQYGIHVARKAGMHTEQCFNTWSIEKIEQWFKQKKRKRNR